MEGGGGGGGAVGVGVEGCIQMGLGVEGCIQVGMGVVGRGVANHEEALWDAWRWGTAGAGRSGVCAFGLV